MPALIRPVDELGFPIPAKFDDPPAGAGEPRAPGHQSFNDSAAGGGSSSSSSPCCSSGGSSLISAEGWLRTFKFIELSAIGYGAMSIGRSITSIKQSPGNRMLHAGLTSLLTIEPRCISDSIISTGR